MLAVPNVATGAVRVLDLRTGRTRWRLPGGAIAGTTLVHQDGQLLTWFDLATGARTADAVLQEHQRFALVGLSQDGTSAVLARTETRTTSIAIVSPRSQTEVYLAGNRWSFAALAGRSLYLRHNGELWRDELRGGGNHPLAMVGPPGVQLSSPGGRYVLTLAVSAAGNAAVDVLDTARGATSTLRLPGRGSAAAARTYTVVFDPDRRHLWAISPGYGRVAHIDLSTRRVVDTYSFPPGAQNSVAAVAAMSPDGERIAVGDAGRVWFVHLASRQVVAGVPHVVLALGWSPDQRHLWAIGERSRVSSLPVR
jgi:DNA-binding beta-propeller fold protein YncE